MIRLRVSPPGRRFKELKGQAYDYRLRLLPSRWFTDGTGEMLSNITSLPPLRRFVDKVCALYRFDVRLDGIKTLLIFSRRKVV